MFDLIILGGGPAGYLAGERAGHAGLNTLVIEKKFLGGVCLNEGCVPSKALLYSAKIFDYARFSEKYGVVTENAKFNQKTAVARKDNVVKTLVGGISAQLKANKVTIAFGLGRIVGRDEEGFVVKAGEEEYKGKRLLIATGSSALVPPISGVKEGIDDGFVLTNREILNLQVIPKRLVIVGGGVIGLEMASYFNSVGSKVTVIEMLDKIAGPADRQISEILMKNYAKKGIEFLLNAKVTKVTSSGVVYEKDGKTFETLADKILLSIGRRAEMTDIGLETIGVETYRGGIKTDKFSRTNISGVYAAGDVNGVSMLAHTAYREAEVAVNHMLDKKDPMRYDAIPSVIYTNPEVAWVGLSEEEAKKQGFDVLVSNITMKYSGRYVAENEGGDGICKMIADRKTRRLLGVHMISNYASEIILSAGILVETQMRIDDIKEIVFPHPTVCEIIREGIFQL